MGASVDVAVIGKATLAGGRTVVAATEHGGKVLLQTQDQDGRAESFAGEHLILATGYKLEMDRLPFLSGAMLQDLRTAEKMPVLSANFESSVAGLHFVGFASMRSFGPVMRFVAGAPHSGRATGEPTRHTAAAGLQPRAAEGDGLIAVHHGQSRATASRKPDHTPRRSLSDGRMVAGAGVSQRRIRSKGDRAACTTSGGPVRGRRAGHPRP